MTNGKVVLGVLAGMAAGALLGVVIAPKKSKTERRLSQKGEDLADALQQAIDEKLEGLLDKVERRFEKTKSHAD